MSTIRVDNFGPSAGGTTYSARGIAKAWVNFNGTGTIAARDSENLSSLTDNGSGDYSINFSNSFNAADYAPCALSTIQAGVSNAGMVVGTRNTSGTPDQTASAVRLVCIGVSSPAEADVGQVNASIHGDLA